MAPDDGPNRRGNGWPPPNFITPNLLLGPEPWRDFELFSERPITAIVSLHVSTEWRWLSNAVQRLGHFGRHLWVRVEDNKTQDLLQFFGPICDFIDRALDPRPGNAAGNDPWARLPPLVLVHCYAGRSRSATGVLAYLMRATGRGRDELLAEIKRGRPIARLHANFKEQLRVWEECGYNVWAADGRPKPPYEAWLVHRMSLLNAGGFAEAALRKSIETRCDKVGPSKPITPKVVSSGPPSSGSRSASRRRSHSEPSLLTPSNDVRSESAKSRRARGASIRRSASFADSRSAVGTPALDSPPSATSGTGSVPSEKDIPKAEACTADASTVQVTKAGAPGRIHLGQQKAMQEGGEGTERKQSRISRK